MCSGSARDAGGDVDRSPASHIWNVGSSCAPATATAGADADAWVLQSAPGDNKGEDSVLRVDSKAGGNSRVLIRFNLPARQPDCEGKAATLRLHSGSFKAGRTLQTLRLDGSWTEDGVSWGSQPSTTGSPAEAQSPSAPGYDEWSATALVNEIYAGSNDGVLIRDAAEGHRSRPNVPPGRRRTTTHLSWSSHSIVKVSHWWAGRAGHPVGPDPFTPSLG